ncbi:hypothetical protein V8E36_009575 [Tilletia maclaganii]
MQLLPHAGFVLGMILFATTIQGQVHKNLSPDVITDCRQLCHDLGRKGRARFYDCVTDCFQCFQCFADNLTPAEHPSKQLADKCRGDCHNQWLVGTSQFHNCQTNCHCLEMLCPQYQT